MESSTILALPSIGLSGILLSVRTKYSPKDQNMQIITTISMHEEKFK